MELSSFSQCRNNIVLKVAYDGSSYFGWQKTNEGPSIESCLEAAIEHVLQHKVRLQAASRTDRGVHAKGQIVNFFTQREVKPYKLRYAIDSKLPCDISILEVESQNLDFHPSLFAKTKEYHYQVMTSPALLPHLRATHWHYPSSLDIKKMKACALLIQGTHNFLALSNQCKEKDTRDSICTIEVSIEETSKNIFLIKMVGDKFLYKMARNIAGLLIYAGTSKIEVENVSSILHGKDRTGAGISAPAHGLTLEKIIY